MQDLIPQLCMVKLLKQYVEAFHHGLREMLIVLERLHGGGLCCRPVVVMLDGEADDFVDALLALGDMICWCSETCLVNMKAKQIWYQVQARAMCCWHGRDWDPNRCPSHSHVHAYICRVTESGVLQC